MAFNWQTFKTRTLTAIVFAAVMLTGLLWNQWSFFVLFSIIHFGCWWEYLRLIEKINHIVFHPYFKMGWIVVGYGLMLQFSGIYEINGYGLKQNFSLPVSGAGFALLLTGIFQKNRITLKSSGAAALGLLYISLSWGLMLDLYKFLDIHIHDTLYVIQDNFLPLAIILSIWVNDTMAYIVGSVAGKRPLSKISPKKTWEGTIGGILLSIGVAWLTAYLILPAAWFALSIMIIAAISAIAGTAGDLLESKLKRMAGVKDSGSLMPGHGGFMDRFDSLLLATPFVWLFVNLL